MTGIKIISVRFFEDDIVDGAYGDTRDSEHVWDAETVDEAIDIIRRHGLTFTATGTDWAGNPDGSDTIDWRTAEREELTAHFVGGWTAEEISAIIDAVG